MQASSLIQEQVLSAAAGSILNLGGNLESISLCVLITVVDKVHRYVGSMAVKD